METLVVDGKGPLCKEFKTARVQIDFGEVIRGTPYFSASIFPSHGKQSHWLRRSGVVLEAKKWEVWNIHWELSMWLRCSPPRGGTSCSSADAELGSNGQETISDNSRERGKPFEDVPGRLGKAVPDRTNLNGDGERYDKTQHPSLSEHTICSLALWVFMANWWGRQGSHHPLCAKPRLLA